MHIAAAGDTDGVDDAVAVILKLLLDFFGNGEHRGNAETVTGMNAYGIDVFNETDGDFLTFGIADNFEFEFLPAQHALFDQHLTDQTGGKTAGNDITQFFDIVNDTAAGSAHGIGRAQNDGITEIGSDLFSFFNGIGRFGLRHGDAEPVHSVFEFDPVFAAFDRFKIDTDDFDTVFFQNSGIVERNRQIQCRLTAEVGQQGIGFFFGDDAFEAVHGKRFNISMIRHAGVGHDRRGVGVGQHHLVTAFAQCLASLRTGIVKFTRLSDNDRTGTDDENLFDICPLCHKKPLFP